MPFLLIEVFLVAKNPRVGGEGVANSTVQIQEAGKTLPLGTVRKSRYAFLCHEKRPSCSSLSSCGRTFGARVVYGKRSEDVPQQQDALSGAPPDDWQVPFRHGEAGPCAPSSPGAGLQGSRTQGRDLVGSGRSEGSPEAARLLL